MPGYGRGVNRQSGRLMFRVSHEDPVWSYL